ncbi:MAG: CBS domain-containing protein [Deltaproteobacteria bacterium]|nr:CBS domain-containing protein [Deltaproteobacteria bacterium]
MDIKSIKVADLMNRDVKVIDKNMSIISAAKQMMEKHVSSFIIMPDNPHDAFGIITRKDVVESFINSGIIDTSILVKAIMSKPCICVHPELSLYNCFQMMLMVGVRRMPVTEGSKLVGIISNTDILEKIVRGV